MDDTDKHYAKLVAATARAKGAIGAASAFFAQHKIKLPFATTAFDAARVPEWANFAVDTRFACK